jgi:hypothetical protein
MRLFILALPLTLLLGACNNNRYGSNAAGTPGTSGSYATPGTGMATPGSNGPAPTYSATPMR